MRWLPMGAPRVRHNLERMETSLMPPSVWLIERGQALNHQPTVWWTGSHETGWTQDATKAQRFSQREDAEAVVDDHSTTGPYGVWAHVVEHGFITLPERKIDALEARMLADADFRAGLAKATIADEDVERLLGSSVAKLLEQIRPLAAKAESGPLSFADVNRLHVLVLDLARIL